MRFRTLPLVLLSLACYAPPGATAQAEAERRPANVISVAGADWLERASRAEEDRPDLVIAAMKLKDGDVVADVGAGTGYFTRRLARAVAPRGRVYANDVQPEMLELLRASVSKEKITNVIPILGATADPRLPDSALDWILLVDVYHEFQEPKPMLARLREALKPDGHVALVEYRAEGTSASHIRREHRMTKDEVLSEWLPAGFRVVEVIESLPSQRLYIFARE
ncbi:MAG TPA: methyltransferase domain-containing protein [Thermoanaerobaculia bacterium]|nr:methyltransferase domain-containing protein [Thermoanaerobaculia bacterium]